MRTILLSKKRWIGVTLAVTAILMSGCSTVQVTEHRASQILEKDAGGTWGGVIVTPGVDDPIPYDIAVESMDVNFVAGGEFHDVNIRILGNLHISDPLYQVNTPIEVVLGAHANTSEGFAIVSLSNAYTKRVEFSHLYESYAKDLIEPIAASLDKISDTKLAGIAIADYSSLKQRSDNASDRTVKKNHNGRLIISLDKAEE